MGFLWRIAMAIPSRPPALREPGQAVWELEQATGQRNATGRSWPTLEFSRITPPNILLLKCCKQRGLGGGWGGPRCLELPSHCAMATQPNRTGQWDAGAGQSAAGDGPSKTLRLPQPRPHNGL